MNKIHEQIDNEQNRIKEVINYIEKEWGEIVDESIINKISITAWKNKYNYSGNIAAKIMN